MEDGTFTFDNGYPTQNSTTMNIFLHGICYASDSILLFELIELEWTIVAIQKFDYVASIR